MFQTERFGRRRLFLALAVLFAGAMLPAVVAAQVVRENASESAVRSN